MAILSIKRVSVGEVGVAPGSILLQTDDSLATVQAAGYLNAGNMNFFQIQILPTDIITALYDFDATTGTSTAGMLIPTFNNGVITLDLYVNPGNVQLPVVDGNFPVFEGTTGLIKDSGISSDSPTFAGDVTAEIYYGTQFTAIPLDDTKGTLNVIATNNSGAYDINLTNAAFGQTTTLTIPDPGASSAKLPVSTLLSKINGGITDTWGGGSTSHDFTATGLASGANVIASIKSATTADVAIVVPQAISANTLRVIFTKDPGANTVVTWISIA